MPLELSESSSAAVTYTVTRQDELVLRLAENPTTGYRWQVAQSGVGELALVDDQFVVATGGAPPGAGGHRVLRFVGRKPGIVRIELALRRAWETAAPAEAQRSFSVVVN